MSASEGRGGAALGLAVALGAIAAACGDPPPSRDYSGAGGAPGGAPAVGGSATGGTSGAGGTRSGGTGAGGGATGGTGGFEPGPDLYGCPTYPDPVAVPADAPGQDTWDAFAQTFFVTYCTRCHSTENVGDERNFAPEGLNWNDEASVRANLSRIRNAIGVGNFMPPSAPTPSCDERLRLVRWIDLGAP